MREPTFQEMMPYGEIGSLILRDIRFDPDDVAFCNPLPSGEVQFRLHTELAIDAGLLIFNDGSPHQVDLNLIDQDSRFKYWSALIKPDARQIVYSFAFKLNNGKPYYYGGRRLTHATETRFTLDLDAKPPFETPDWAKGAIIYQIFPERFGNSDPALNPDVKNLQPWGSKPHPAKFMGGDLPAITQKIDYLDELGVDCIYLNPIFHSPTNHKYDATDYYNVDPAFGGNDALRDLVKAAHARDIKIILDASFNHCHPTFDPFQDLVEKEDQSEYKDWFTIFDYPIRIGYRPHMIPEERKQDPNFQGYINSLIEPGALGKIPVSIYEDEGDWFEPSYMAWYNVISMPKLNQNNPAVRQYFIDVATYWIREYDIDGWRMDVAQFVPDQFWREFRNACKAVKPDCYLISEIWGDTAHWLNGDMFDATMNYLFREITLDFFTRDLIDANGVKEGLLRLEHLYAPQVTAIQQNLLSSHDVARFLHEAHEDITSFKLATLFQMTIPGAPGIYYGDEIGMSGGHDPDNRRTFPWDKPESWATDLLSMFKTLTGLRKSYPALRIGGFEWVWASENGDGIAFKRTLQDSEVEIVINRGNEPLRYQPEIKNGTVLFGLYEINEEDLIILPRSGLVIAPA